jgi:hypothetical protein
MRPLLAAVAASGLLVAAGGICQAQPVVRQEPFDGQMVPGAVVLVDDGSCGKGRIKEVTGGEVAVMNPRPRSRRCIPKAKK